MKKFLLLNFIHSDPRKHYIRTRLYDAPDYINYVILADLVYKDYLLENNIEIYDEVLDNRTNLSNINIDDFKNNKIIFFINNTKNDSLMFKIINFFNPNAILLTVTPVNKLFLKSFVNIKKYYITHGIFHNIDYKIIAKKWPNNVSYFAGDKISYQQIEKFKKSKNFKIDGLPQYDYILKYKDDILKNKNSLYQNYQVDKDTKIFLIIGPQFVDIFSIENLIELVNLINKYYRKNIIIFKNRSEENYRYYQVVTMHNLIITDPHDILYQYLSADNIIIIGGGTTYLESLLVNLKTIVYQVYNKGKKYKIENSDDLLIANNVDNLSNMIKNIDTLVQNEKYENAVNKYICNVIGDNVKPVSIDVCNYIYQDNVK